MILSSAVFADTSVIEIPEGVTPCESHVWEEVQFTEPTCSNAGYLEELCNVCSAVRKTTIDKKAHIAKKVIIKAGYRKNGRVVSKCSVCKKEIKKYSSIPMVYTVKATAKVKYGKGIKIKVLKKNKKALNSKYYSVTKFKKKKIGTQTLSFKLKGLYSGTVKRKVIVIPSNIKIKSLKAKQKSLTVSYSSAKGGVNYQVAIKKKGGSWKVFGAKSTKKKISSLKPGKKYYVKARAVKKVSGKNYYGSWTKAKSVKTKPKKSSGGKKKSGGSNTVYVTATGERYHRYTSCRGLTRARAIYSMSLAEAKSEGYTPCHLCY